ncbi:hypothetical protein [Prevotella sp. P6B1]|uniref:hypothetical protein n=1 Tax=Prevotella sp. P6B1 TaxID=1410613 RepID=UPI0012DD4299|nr:hypothetical protein [Prevotella sp. P6B1]
MEKEQNLPRPTVEQLNEYDNLSAALSSSDLQGAAYDDTINRINQLISSFDWNNYEFTDPVTGLKGVKNAAGQILVPAQFEGFTILGDHHVFNLKHLAAQKNGKFGVVKADGKGETLCDFRFDTLIWDAYTGLYHGRWDGIKEKFGYVTIDGKVFIPNVITKFYEPWNDFILLESDGKVGALDVSTMCFVLPQYDKADWEPDTNVIFYKDGVAGYVIEETVEFVPVDQFEEDEKYDDVYVFNTNINI